MGEPIAAVGVGIPAHNEERRIAACVRSVLAAAAQIGVPVTVAVAADRCTDDTVASARRAFLGGGVDGLVIDGDFGGAGAARAAALDVALRRLPVDPGRAWLATTDADTIVARGWLVAQLRWAGQGADGVAGLVDVSWEGGPADLPTRHAESIASGGIAYGHRHVHGANLGLRADRWLQVGGCGPSEVGEDHELWRRLRAAGAELHAVDDVRVRTSGRLVARAPRGFSHHLRALSPVGQPGIEQPTSDP